MVRTLGWIARALAVTCAGCALLVARPRPDGWHPSQPPRECPSLALAHVVDGAIAVASGVLSLAALSLTVAQGCRRSASSGEPDQPDCGIVVPVMVAGPIVVGGVVAETVVGRRWDRRCREDSRAHDEWLAEAARAQRARSAPPSAPPADAGPVDAGPAAPADGGVPPAAPAASADGGAD